MYVQSEVMSFSTRPKKGMGFLHRDLVEGGGVAVGSKGLGGIVQFRV